MKVRIDRREHWDAVPPVGNRRDQGAVLRILWVVTIPDSIHAPVFPTRRAARAWCDERGYDWRPEP